MTDERERDGVALDKAPEPPRFEDVMAPVALPRKRPPLPAVLGGIAAIVVVVALVITIVVVKPFSLLRGTDYRSGISQVAQLQNDYNAIAESLDRSLIFLASQSSAYDASAVAEVKQDTAKLRKSLESSARLRVVNKDEDVNAAYGLYERQATRFLDVANNLASSAKALSEAKTTCEATPSGTVFDADYASEYEQYIPSCRDKINQLAKAPAKVVAEFATTLSDSLDKTSDIIGQLQSIGSSVGISTGSATGQQLTQLSSQLVDLDISAGMFSDFHDRLRQTRDNASPAKPLARLKTALEQGYRSKSGK